MKNILIKLILVLLISSCHETKEISFNLYVVNEDTVFLDINNYLNLRVKKDSVQILKPSYYELEVIDIDTINEILKFDTIFYDEKVLRTIKWDKIRNKNYLVYKLNDALNNDTLILDQTKKSIVNDIPFYFKPYDNYYQVFYMGKKYSNGMVFSKYQGVEEIQFYNKSKQKAYKFSFEYLNFNFSELKPDYMYFDIKTFLPIKLEYNSLRLNGMDSVYVEGRILEIAR